MKDRIEEKEGSNILNPFSTPMLLLATAEVEQVLLFSSGFDV